MCIISGAVNSVSKTKILIALNATKDRQLTVYANAVDNSTPQNAMILPYPSPESIRFHDLSDYKDIFQDCAKSFRPKTMNLSASRSIYLSSKGSSSLAVFQVGSYNVSVANSIDDLRRINRNVFQLTPGCLEVLAGKYAGNFGFVICQLKNGAENYHPMAYSHTIPSSLFVPTKHYHDGEQEEVFRIAPGSGFGPVGALEYNATNIDSSPMFMGGMSSFTNSRSGSGRQVYMPTDFADDWDHTIYFYNLAPSEQFLPTGIQNSSDWVWDKTFHLKTNKIEGFDFGSPTHFERVEIRGNHRNVDITPPSHMVRSSWLSAF